MQRLHEELERQGEAVNHHASLLRQRNGELDDALDRATRAHDELISMEPPTLARAVGGLEVLLRVSTRAASFVAGKDAEGRERGGDGGDGDGGGGGGGDGAGVGVVGDGGGVQGMAAKVWCLVRYAVPSSKRRGKAQQGEEAQEGLAADGTEDGRGGEGEPRGERGEEGEVEEREAEGGGGGGGAGGGWWSCCLGSAKRWTRR